jgi:glutaminase
MLGKFDELAGAPKRSVKCDMITCDSEMDNCEKNMALIYYMKSKNVSLIPLQTVDYNYFLYIVISDEYVS